MSTPTLGHPRRLVLFLRDRWFSIDLRTLGLFRIVFGLRLILGLMQDTWAGNLVAFFSNDGVLTNHFALFAPVQPRVWSLLFAFSTPGEVAVAFTAILCVYVLYTLGWKTRLMQILVVICWVSVLNRNLLLQDGGGFVTTVLAVWTAFLPVGARFSIDQWRARRRAGGFGSPAHLASDAGAPASAAPAGGAPADRHVSFVCLAVLAQIAVIYLFNAANKSGPTWESGTAVHYVLWQNRMNTGLAALLRQHEPGWFSPFATRATLLFEWTAPVLILTPVLQTWARRLLIAGMCVFHLGISSVLSLGAFSYVMMISGLLLLGPRDWQVLEALVRRWRPARRPSAPPATWTEGGDELSSMPPSTPASLSASMPGAAPERRPQRTAWTGPRWLPRFTAARWRTARVALRELAAIVLFIACVTELTLANACVAPAAQLRGRPEWMAAMLQYLRVYQAWGMFSADAPLDDGIVIVDAVLADGSHVDPLTGAPPDPDPFANAPWYLGHHWAEYMSYYPWERHRPYRNGLLEYALRRHAATEHRADKKIRSVEIAWVSATSPAPGQVKHGNVKREVLVSYAAPGP